LLRCKQPPLARPSSCMLNLDTSLYRDQLDSAVQPLAVSELPATVERQQHTACTRRALRDPGQFALGYSYTNQLDRLAWAITR
jgi:hypothetical protein